jgi:hypothetical protein
MVPEEGLLFLGRFWLGWEPMVWEVREPVVIQEEEVEVIFLGVEETSRVVEGEVAMPLRMPPTHSISRGPIQATDRF